LSVVLGPFYRTQREQRDRAARRQPSEKGRLNTKILLWERLLAANLQFKRFAGFEQLITDNGLNAGIKIAKNNIRVGMDKQGHPLAR